MRCEQSEERIPSLGQYNYSKKLTNSVNMYYYINQNKYLINENKYNFMSGDPIKYKPYPPIIKSIHRITKRKDLYEYQPTNGNTKDKKVISNYLNNIGINATTGNISFTYSTTHAFNLIFQCLAKIGDGIIIPVPSYGLFDFVPERFGLKVIFLPLKKENDWLINPIDLENAIKDFECKNSKSKVSFLYNMNPHNPTGKVMSYNNIDILKKIGNLSEGEKIRLMLSILLQNSMNCIIFDEPTNHIDMETKEVLEDSIDAYDGTFIFVSHDRYFINKFADKVYEFKDGKVTLYYGNYDYYKEKKEEVKKGDSLNKIRKSE